MVVSQIASAFSSSREAPPRSSASRASGTAGAPSAPLVDRRTYRLDELLGGQRSDERLDIDEQQRRGGGARCGDRTRQRVAAEIDARSAICATSCGGVSATSSGNASRLKPP